MSAHDDDVEFLRKLCRRLELPLDASLAEVHQAVMMAWRAAFRRAGLVSVRDRANALGEASMLAVADDRVLRIAHARQAVH